MAPRSQRYSSRFFGTPWKSTRSTPTKRLALPANFVRIGAVRPHPASSSVYSGRSSASTSRSNTRYGWSPGKYRSLSRCANAVMWLLLARPALAVGGDAEFGRRRGARPPTSRTPQRRSRLSDEAAGP